MNRSDFQQLSRVRIAEAKLLLDHRMWDGAYYLAGYSIECALKARIAKLTKRYDFPEKQFVEKTYTHEIMKLVNAGGLIGDYTHDVAVNKAIAVNFGLVKDWTESSRYQRISELQAKQLYEAIVDRHHGVLRWVKQHW